MQKHGSKETQQQTLSKPPSLFWRATLFGLLIFGMAFGLGVYAQKQHLLLFFKRWASGYPVELKQPQRTLLDWDYGLAAALKPEFSLGALSLEEIETGRERYVNRLRDLLGLDSFPADFKTQAEIVETTKLAKVLRQKILIETESGLKVPFYLFVPRVRNGPLPAILVLHGHGSGKMETAGLVPSYQASNALALAEAGFVTVAPDFRGFGELGWLGPEIDASGREYGKSIHVQDAMNQIRMGRTLLGAFLHDGIKVLDYVASREEVDAGRIGVAGTSMGADAALWLAMIEPRIQAVVASHPPLLLHPLRAGDLGAFHPCVDLIPDIYRSFRLEELPLLIAPRPLLIDFNRHADAQANRERIENVYRAAGHDKKILIKIRKGGDRFYLDRAQAWFERWL